MKHKISKEVMENIIDYRRDKCFCPCCGCSYNDGFSTYEDLENNTSVDSCFKCGWEEGQEIQKYFKVGPDDEYYYLLEN